MGYADDLGDPVSYLLDAFLPASETFFILVTEDRDVAQRFALRLHQDGVPGSLDPGSDGMFALAPERLQGLSREAMAMLLDEASAAGAWVYLEELEVYIDHLEVLRAVFVSLEEPTGPVVLGVTHEDGWHLLQDAAPRLVAMADVVMLDSGTHVQSNGLLTTSNDRHDTGWTAVVKFVLSAPLGEDELPADPAADRALALVDSVNLIDSTPYPKGMLVGFQAQALLSSQLETVLAQATLVASRVVGRPLRDGESIEAMRGVYHS